MDGSGVQKLADLAYEAALPRMIEIKGGTYTDRNLKQIRNRMPGVEPLALTTLTGLLDWLTRNPDGVSGDAIEENPHTDEGMLLRADILHVVSPTQVNVLTSYQPDDVLSRLTLATASFTPPCAMKYGVWMDVEEFQIALQTQFVETANRNALMGFVGNLSNESAVNRKDDGVTQTAVARAGIVNVEKVAVENPVVLAPYRTFPEVEQPESPFILRLRGGGDGGRIMAALFEADGGKWRIGAGSRVQDYIVKTIKGTVAERILVIR